MTSVGRHFVNQMLGGSSRLRRMELDITLPAQQISIVDSNRLVLRFLPFTLAIDLVFAESNVLDAFFATAEP